MRLLPVLQRGSLLLASVLLLISCATSGSGASGGQDTCENTPPKGTPEAFTLGGESMYGAEVRALEQCGDPQAGYIRLVPDSGTRVLTLGRNEEGGVDDCTPDAENPTTCPRVQVGEFLEEVYHELKAREIHTIGTGLGVCGDHTGDYDAWNVSVIIHDWRDADESVEILARKLDEWDVKSNVGISVKPIACAIPL